MRQLIYAPRAKEDIEAIYHNTLDQSSDPDVALRLTIRLRDKCEHLAGLPGTLGTARTDLLPKLRSTPCEGYVVFFRYLKEQLEILTILHGKRDVVAYFDGWNAGNR